MNAASAQTADRDPGPLETQFVSLVNNLRVQQGLTPFVVDGEIRDVAMGWTQKMADAGRISHNPDLGKQVTASWRKLGENVGTGPDVPSVEDAFEASPGHRKNLLDPDFTHISITVVVRGERIYVTQQFRQPDKAATPAPATPAPAGPSVTPDTVPTQLALAVTPAPQAGPKLTTNTPKSTASAKAAAAAKAKAARSKRTSTRRVLAVAKTHRTARRY